MCLFLSKLAGLLSQESKDWRSNTVLLLDGASYHKSESTRAAFEDLKVKVILSAPYSYSAAPVELFFAYFKKANINPTNAATGRR